MFSSNNAWLKYN
uniref:Uncharacterized protein n=1 Tax=Arundo donax TaxID=35708 RepID=A0A0A9A263_ARUDO